MNNLPQTPASVRLSVAKADGTAIATVILSLTEDHAGIGLQISGAEEAAKLQRLVDMLRERCKGAIDAGDAHARLNGVRSIFTDIIQGAGYAVAELPAGDVKVTGILDLRTGQVAMAQSVLNPLSADAPDIARALADVLKAMPTKMNEGIIQRLSSRLDTGDHEAAFRELAGIRDEGLLAFANQSAFDILQKLDASALSSTDEKTVREIRAALAGKLQIYSSAENDIQALLGRNDLCLNERARLELSLGIVLNSRGSVSAAIALWRRVALNTDLEAATRGWAWRNLSLVLSPRNTESLQAARLSADCFLEAGEKRNAVASLLRVCDILEHHDRLQAASELASLEHLVNAPDLWGQLERAALHHNLGNRYLGWRQHKLALEEAKQAIALRRGLSGQEDELISSLHLAVVAALGLDQLTDANAYQSEADRLTEQRASARSKLVARIEAMFDTFDPLVAAEVLAEARSTNDSNLWGAAELAAILANRDQDSALQLARLEDLDGELRRKNARAAAHKPVGLAIVNLLRKSGDLSAACDWLSKMLQSDAGSIDLRDYYADTLRQAQRWGDLAAFMKQQLAVHGQLPGLLSIYGEALLEAGDLSAAVTQLTNALRLMPEDAPPRMFIEKLRNRALDLGGTILPPPTINAELPVSRADLERALRDYRTFISGEKRMTFWRSTPGDHEWTDQPERQAKDLLHTFLKARFTDRIDIYEELSAGAGRIDLLLKFASGLQAIIELKLCGYGYSSEYAASGEDQIKHYTEARGVRLGYLVVHDARLSDLGKPLLSPTGGADTIFEYLIDIAPRVPKKRGRRGKKS